MFYLFVKTFFLISCFYGIYVLYVIFLFMLYYIALF